MKVPSANELHVKQSLAWLGRREGRSKQQALTLVQWELKKPNRFSNFSSVNLSDVSDLKKSSREEKRSVKEERKEVWHCRETKQIKDEIHSDFWLGCTCRWVRGKEEHRKPLRHSLI